MASGSITGATTGHLGFVNISKSIFSGSCTAYFEAVAINTATSINASLGLGTGISADIYTLNIPANTTSYTLFRSTDVWSLLYDGSFRASLPNAGTPTLKAVRLIILQDTGTSNLTSSETQIEIGNRETAKVVTTANTNFTLTAPKYWKYDSSLWDGTLTCYADVTTMGSSTSYTRIITLQESPDLSTWTSAVTIISGTINITTPTRYRSIAFTPKSGYYYRIVMQASNTMATLDIYNAKIVVQQTGSLSPDVVIESTTAGSNSNGVWGGTGTREIFSQSFKPLHNTINAIYFFPSKQGSPTDNFVGTFRSSHGGTSLGSFTLTPAQITGFAITVNFSPITVTIGNTYYIEFSRTGVRDTVNYFGAGQFPNDDVYPDGVTETRDNSVWTATGGDLNLTFYTITGQITKLEEQYLLANTTLATGTTLQSFLTKYDPAEWSGVDTSFVHQVDSSATTMTAEIDTAAGVIVPNSSVTGTALVKQSSAITIPTISTVLDVKATTNSGSIYGSRMLARINKTAVVVTQAVIKMLGMLGVG